MMRHPQQFSLVLRFDRDISPRFYFEYHVPKDPPENSSSTTQITSTAWIYTQPTARSYADGLSQPVTLHSNTHNQIEEIKDPNGNKRQVIFSEETWQKQQRLGYTSATSQPGFYLYLSDPDRWTNPICPLRLRFNNLSEYRLQEITSFMYPFIFHEPKPLDEDAFRLRNSNNSGSDNEVTSLACIDLNVGISNNNITRLFQVIDPKGDERPIIGYKEWYATALSGFFLYLSNPGNYYSET